MSARPRRDVNGGFDPTSSLVVLGPDGELVTRVDGLRAPSDGAAARLRELVAAAPC
ncbi:MAG: hypothetical protein KF878_29060 [Planctomycetes bacterium]|nr:hypothetical protein [Planctomycetota bacterium]